MVLASVCTRITGGGGVIKTLLSFIPRVSKSVQVSGEAQEFSFLRNS